MDVKEKMVELLDDYTDHLSVREIHKADFAEKFADHLIAHGVTVQDGKDNDVPTKWIPVTERLPEKHKRVLTVSDNGNIDVDWVDKFGVWIGDIMSFDEVTHWMPLPELPKGE